MGTTALRRAIALPVALAAAIFGAPAAAAQAPETSIDSAPPAFTNSPNAIFAFSGTGSSFECKLDGGAFASCTSPRAYSGLAEGQHTFQVRSVTGGIGADPTPASHTWTVDLTPPDTALGSAPPPLTNSTSASFGFSSSEPGGFGCSLNGGAFAACSPPHALNGLADGTRTFSVRAVDQAGNVDPSPAAHTWTVDTVAPETVIGGGPSGLLGSASLPLPPLSFTASEPATFGCAADGGPFAPCASPFAALPSSDGDHAVQVRATDGAGNTDPSPATRAWALDTLAPLEPPVWIREATNRGPVRPSGGRVRVPATKRFQLTSRLHANWDGGAKYNVLRGSAEPGDEPDMDVHAGGTTDEQARFTGQPGRTYCWRVTALDPAGNASPPGEACTSLPYRAKQLKGNGWKLTKSRRSYLGFYKTGGDRLVATLDGRPEVARVGLVVTKCVSCGRVRVRVVRPPPTLAEVQQTGVPSTLVLHQEEVNLRSLRTRHRRLVYVAKVVGPDAGILSVVVDRLAGKPRIEGVAVSSR
jgi:hypothetical protein